MQRQGNRERGIWHLQLRGETTKLVGEVVVVTDELMGEKNRVTLCRHQIERSIVVAFVSMMDFFHLHPFVQKQSQKLFFIKSGKLV